MVPESIIIRLHSVLYTHWVAASHAGIHVFLFLLALFCPSILCIFRNIRLRVRVYSVRIYCIVLVTFSENTLPPAYLMEISLIISLALRGWLATNNGKLSPLQSTIEKKRNPRI